MQAKRVVCIGESLFDDLPSGRRPGGGPFNTAAHFATLGGRSALLSAVGHDDPGDDLLAAVRQHGVDPVLVQRSALPTGIVDVDFDGAGEASYTIVRPVAWDEIQHAASGDDVLESQLGLTAKQLGVADACCAWLLGARSDTTWDAMQWAFAKTRPDCLRAADLGLREGHYAAHRIDALLREVDVVKLNAEELVGVCQLLDLNSDPTVLANCQSALAKAYDLDTVVVTRGPRGAMSYRAGTTTQAGGQPVGDVVDTVGCGDAFFAGYLYARLAGQSEEMALEAGCKQGAYAATLAGGLPPPTPHADGK